MLFDELDASCSVTAKLAPSALAPGAVRTVCRKTPGTLGDPMQFIADRCELELPAVDVEVDSSLSEIT